MSQKQTKSKTTAAQSVVDEGIKRARRMASDRGDVLDELLRGAHPEMEPGTLGGPALAGKHAELTSADLATVADTTMVNLATVANHAPEPLPLATVAKKTPVAKTATVQPEAKEGYLQLPYTVLDNLLRTLEPAEQLAYLRLYRLVYGFKDRLEILVSYETLASACNLGKRTVIRAVDGLVAKGLVERSAVIDGPRGERGNRYRLINAAVVKKAMVDEPARAGDKTATVAKMARMKESLKETHERAPAPDAPADFRKQTVDMLRAIARTYRHSTPDADEQDVRARLGQWFETEGREVDQGMIDEALKGMLR